MTRKKRPFQIPEELLARINEMTSGGFILFTFDELGQPQINSRFDSAIHGAAMNNHISTWMRAMDNVTLHFASQAIISKNMRPRRKKGTDGEESNLA